MRWQLPAILSSHVFLALAALLRSRGYSAVLVHGQVLQYLLSVGTWLLPSNRAVNWADRTCAAANIQGLMSGHLQRTQAPAALLALGLLLALSMKAMDFRYARKNEVTGWYLAWHATILLGNAAVVLLF